MDKLFTEIILKIKVEHSTFVNYFFQHKDESCIHNSFQISESQFILSGFGILNILSDYNFKYTLKENDICFIFNFDQCQLDEIYKIFEFSDSDQNNLQIEHIFIPKDIHNFYKKYISYFEEVVRI
jgi:hypothetical protein